MSTDYGGLRRNQDSPQPLHAERRWTTSDDSGQVAGVALNPRVLGSSPRGGNFLERRQVHLCVNFGSPRDGRTPHTPSDALHFSFKNAFREQVSPCPNAITMATMFPCGLGRLATLPEPTMIHLDCPRCASELQLPDRRAGS